MRYLNWNILKMQFKFKWQYFQRLVVCRVNSFQTDYLVNGTAKETLMQRNVSLWSICAQRFKEKLCDTQMQQKPDNKRLHRNRFTPVCVMLWLLICDQKEKKRPRLFLNWFYTYTAHFRLTGWSQNFYSSNAHIYSKCKLDCFYFFINFHCSSGSKDIYKYYYFK